MQMCPYVFLLKTTLFLFFQYVHSAGIIHRVSMSY